MKTVLVTGASGFLGRHTIKALRDRGYVVHGCSRQPPPDAACQWHAADLLAGDDVRMVLERARPTHLLHLAWVMEHGRYWTAPENFQWVEVSIALCRHFAAGGGRRWVGAGTCAEYAWDDAESSAKPLHEERTPRAPRHQYGIAKNATFELLRSYARATGLGFAWGRVFFPYGPHDARPTLVPSAIRALLAGKPALATHGRQARDFIHVRDVANALAALVDSEVEGPVNIASGTATTVGDVVQQLGALLGRPELVRLGALEARPDDPAYLVADIGRLRTEVGFTPKIGLSEGLRETVDWWVSTAP